MAYFEKSPKYSNKIFKIISKFENKTKILTETREIFEKAAKVKKIQQIDS